MSTDQPRLTFSEVDVSFRNLCSAFAQTLNLPSLKGQAGFKGVLDEIVVARPAIDGDHVTGRLF